MRNLILALFLLLPAMVQAQTCVQADLNHPETVTLNWQDNSTDESGFIVERKQDAGAFAVIAAALAPNTKTYIDTSVKRAAVAVTYTYRVKAFRSSRQNRKRRQQRILHYVRRGDPAAADPSGAGRIDALGDLVKQFQDYVGR